MLWLKVKVGGSVDVDGARLTLLAYDGRQVVVAFAGESFTVHCNSSRNFPNFRLVPGYTKKNQFRLGFDAPRSVRIRTV